MIERPFSFQFIHAKFRFSAQWIKFIVDVKISDRRVTTTFSIMRMSVISVTEIEMTFSSEKPETGRR